jgi:DNA polymerase III epsilon subunit-like protein
MDIETTNLNADFGTVLCGVIKPRERKPIIFRADHENPHWHTKRSDDSAVVKAIVQELDQYDIWIIHNGAKFDLPFLRTRLLKFGLQPLSSKKLIDPVLLARNKLRMSYNSLEQIANHMGCNTKTEVRPDEWLKAALDGDRKSMGYIVQHCVEDVLTLEKVATELKVYSSTYNTYGSGF